MIKKSHQSDEMNEKNWYEEKERKSSLKMKY